MAAQVCMANKAFNAMFVKLEAIKGAIADFKKDELVAIDELGNKLGYKEVLGVS